MPGGVEGMTADYFERCWRVCTFGAFLFVREAAKHMSPRGEGSSAGQGRAAH